MSHISRLATGIFLLALFGGSFVAIAPFTLGRAMLTVVGTTARGTVVEKRESSISSRYRLRRAVYRLKVKVEDRNGIVLEADHSVPRKTFELAREGGKVDVIYWAQLPMLNTVGPIEWSDPWLSGGSAFALVLLWLAVATIFRTFFPPPDSPSEQSDLVY